MGESSGLNQRTWRSRIEGDARRSALSAREPGARPGAGTSVTDRTVAVFGFLLVAAIALLSAVTGR